jgi:hemoglobin
MSGVRREVGEVRGCEPSIFAIDEHIRRLSGIESLTPKLAVEPLPKRIVDKPGLCGGILLDRKENFVSEKSLYERLGGYEGITAFANDLLTRLRADAQLGRFWQNRGDDGIAREKQLLVDYLCHAAGGPMYYTGRDMKISHKGMKISESDWSIFLKHAAATMEALRVAKKECDEVAAFVLALKAEIVEP